MSMNRSGLISWAMRESGKMGESLSGVSSSWVTGSRGGDMGVGRSGMGLYHWVGIWSCGRKIFLIIGVSSGAVVSGPVR